MYGGGAAFALAILLIGFVASVPQLSRLYTPDLPRPWPAFVPLFVWSVSILVAFFVLAFANRLRKMEAKVEQRARPGRTLVVLALLVYFGYLLYRFYHGAL